MNIINYKENNTKRKNAPNYFHNAGAYQSLVDKFAIHVLHKQTLTRK